MNQYLASSPYTVVLHDFKNLALQVITCTDFAGPAYEIAESLNYVFEQAGRDDQFEAEVIERPNKKGES